MEITTRERLLIIDEVYERVKDMIYAEKTAKQQIADMLSLSFLRCLNETETLTVSYHVKMLGYDIIQIVSRYRRNKLKRETKKNKNSN